MAKKKTPDQPAGGGDYSADDLQHLSDRDHVRERPAMYIGDISTRGLHHLVYEPRPEQVYPQHLPQRPAVDVSDEALDRIVRHGARCAQGAWGCKSLS